MSDKKKSHDLILSTIPNLRFDDLSQLVDFAREKGAFDIIPNQEGVEKGAAHLLVKGQTQERLDLIFSQMQVLARQAEEIKERARLSELLYQVKLKFKPVSGQIYYLCNDSTTGEFSITMIAPDEWKQKQTQKDYLAKVRFLSDGTWQIIETYQET